MIFLFRLRQQLKVYKFTANQEKIPHILTRKPRKQTFNRTTSLLTLQVYITSERNLKCIRSVYWSHKNLISDSRLCILYSNRVTLKTCKRSLMFYRSFRNNVVKIIYDSITLFCGFITGLLFSNKKIMAMNGMYQIQRILV